ncbi:hypothetical protein ACQEV4_40490 [Streptomyces shenzhenensis]|uniref:hypothetical protein n=1 Tax=Streptomyces shenzhenensis TaxID=943815 RepID=UPI003D9330A2
MAYTYVQPGQSLTADTLNAALMVGQVVFTATRDTAQTFSNTASTANANTGNAVSWDAVNMDDLAGWAAATPTRYTAQRAGWYELNGAISFAGNTTGSRVCAWFMNGSLLAGGHGQRVAANTTTVSASAVTLPVLMAAGDYIELCAGQSSGGDLASATGGPRPSINIKFVRPV